MLEHSIMFCKKVTANDRREGGVQKQQNVAGQKFGPGPAGPPGEHFLGITAQVTSGEIQRHPRLYNIKEICRGAELKHNASQCGPTYTPPVLFLAFLKYANVNDLSPLYVTSPSHQYAFHLTMSE
ncbi:hypothetical protein E1301_Tti017278 [Triplophysa tibetana]|uniref:Uncharacterized protein n=1 Tax=Triplophysa tibetana TaxID=1572043 RepID=A0A5A9PAW0_9TELE|nr:hypothetical protein E1301_Tti017278 [Triplophysa tibetana]